MTSQMFPNRFGRWSKATGHAVAILILTIAFSVFGGDFTFLKGSEALYKGLFRFFRITLLLCLPLYLLFPIFEGLGRIVQRGKGTFLEVAEKQNLEIRPTKHSLLRPIQGIGIGLLFGVKLLLVPLGALMISVLRIIVGLPTFGIFVPVLMALPFSVFALIGSRFGVRAFMAVGLLPFVILSMTIERFFILIEGSGALEALRTGAGSAAVAAITYKIIQINPLQLTFFFYPELLLAIMGLLLLLRNYSAYRLSEILRFKVLRERS